MNKIPGCRLNARCCLSRAILPGELRSRLLAGWVAENVLAEQRARGVWLPTGLQRGAQRQANIEFAWREDIITTPNPAFRRIDIRVFTSADDSHALAHLVGFVSHPPGTLP